MTELKMGDRFKDYERVSDHYLTRRQPVVARIDGRSFHTFTRKFARPYDWEFAAAMNFASIELCREVQGCKLAYVQSDEINLLLTDYEEIATEAWFGNRLNKMVSIGASIASIMFTDSIRVLKDDTSLVGMFDARFFNIPENDTTNYFVWRQKDAERNSLQMLAQSNFSHKSLQGLNSSALQEKLFTEKGVNYNDIDPYQKRGAIVIKREGSWKIEPAPIFSQNREIIEDLIPKP